MGVDDAHFCVAYCLPTRASTWGKPGGLYRLRESVRTVAELVERANAKLEGLGMLMQ